MGKLVERQVIASWYKPEEKLPPEDWDMMLLTISGHGKHVQYDHALVIGGYDPENGWFLEGPDEDKLTEFTVHAWSDIEPYRG